MNLVNMKSPERDEPCESLACERPEYPYGLRLYLGDEELSKLGVITPPATGSQIMISAKVVVTSTEVREEDGKRRTSASFQITDMALGSVGDNGGVNMASKLYGS